MGIVLITIGALLVALVIFLLAVFISSRRGGNFATQTVGFFMRTRLGRRMMRHVGANLGGDGKVSLENIQEVMGSHPELIEKLAAPQGVSPQQARAALKQFSNLSPEQQQGVLTKAQQGGISGEVATRPPAQEARAQAKRKAAARNRRKQAKKQRKR